MIAVVTVLLAFPLGYFVHNRLAANLTYAVAYLWAYTFQAVYLLMEWSQQHEGLAGEEFPLSYGLVTLCIFGVGFGLVWSGGRVRRRFGRRSTAPTPA